MINYIRHDHEFYGTVKLKSGDEVLGQMIATEEDGQTVLFISDPATPKDHIVDKDGEPAVGVALTKWMLFSDEAFYIVNEDNVVTVAPLSIGATMMYKMWQRKEMGGDDEDTEYEIPVNENMGLVGKVSELRKKLEDQWNKGS